MLNEGVDPLNQFLDAAKRAATDGSLGDQAEPTLHLVEPRGIGRCVVDVAAGPLRQPGSHLGVLVGA